MPTRFEKSPADASEQIALEIRRHLERSRLQPGERLGSESELAAEFGVSRPTLREALRLLSSSHLIRATQGRNGGIFVANTPNEGMSHSVSASVATMIAAESVDLVDLMQARMFMESPLARLAAEHRTPETVKALEAALAAAEAAVTGTPEFNAADFAFHRAIAQAAGNELMLAFTGWTLDVLQPHLADEIAPHAEKALLLDQHDAILCAIRRGQPAAAEKAMRAHIAYLREIVAGL